MSRSIFRCFSSCFRFALAAMAAAPREEAGRARSGSRAALRRGPAVPRAALAAAAALRQRAPPALDLAASARLDFAGRRAEATPRGGYGARADGPHQPAGPGQPPPTPPPPPPPPPPPTATFPTSPEGKRGGRGTAREGPPWAAGSQVSAGALCWPGGVSYCGRAEARVWAGGKAAKIQRWW